MTTADDKDRAGRLRTEAGDTALRLRRLTGTSHVNDLFSYQIEAVSEAAQDAAAHIGTHARVELLGPHGASAIDGIVTGFHSYGKQQDDGDTFVYGLEIRPWLWLASRRRDHRIFHALTVTEIVSEVLAAYSGHGNPHLRIDTKERYEALEYTVQYGETDLDFVRRLLERHGISFRFEAGTGFAHTLVLFDDPGDLPLVPDGLREVVPVTRSSFVEGERFWSLQAGNWLQTGGITMRDFNFKSPTQGMEATETAASGDRPAVTLESYEYPGGYLDQEAGRRVAAMRAREQLARHSRWQAEGCCPSVQAGMRLEIDPGPSGSGLAKTMMACLSSSVLFDAESYRSGEGTAMVQVGTFHFAPADAPLLPERVTAVPRIHGPLTAMVVGASSEEIDVDEYGRVLVLFHWDTARRVSMRCRVSQSWAHRGWGGMVIPRVGMEVTVEFIGGDPDHPIVTGCVYNGRNMPPYELPAFKTRSTFRSQSHKASGYNELRFDDEADNQEVFLQAERYFNARIKDDATWQIEGSRDETVDRNSSSLVKGNRHSRVEGDEVSEVEGHRHARIGTDAVTKTGSSHELDAGLHVVTRSGGDHLTSAGGNFSVQANGTAVIEASAGLTLKCAGSFITVDPSGVTISGPLVRINSGGAALQATPGRPGSPAGFEGPFAKRYDRSYKE